METQIKKEIDGIIDFYSNSDIICGLKLATGKEFKLYCTNKFPCDLYFSEGKQTGRFWAAFLNIEIADDLYRIMNLSDVNDKIEKINKFIDDKCKDGDLVIDSGDVAFSNTPTNMKGLTEAASKLIFTSNNKVSSEDKKSGKILEYIAPS